MEPNTQTLVPEIKLDTEVQMENAILTSTPSQSIEAGQAKGQRNISVRCRTHCSTFSNASAACAWQNPPLPRGFLQKAWEKRLQHNKSFTQELYVCV